MNRPESRASKKPRRPTPAEIRAAAGKTVPDVIAPGLRLWFVGINPGLYSAAVGHHFARPGNRFWPALYAAGFTPRLFSPYEERELLSCGYGITNISPRATAAAAELSAAELAEGAQALEQKVRRCRPRLLAFLGMGAYRKTFGRPKADIGLQAETIGGAPVWLLPNPSGLNANYRPEELARLLRELRGRLENEK